MLTLAFDTSSPVGSVALLRDGQLMAETATHSSAAAPRAKTVTHSTNLVPAIEGLMERHGLRLADCDLIAVGLGPGSFTGVRVGIATAKGFALSAKKPMVGVSSMDALALGNKDRLPRDCTSLAAIVDAGRGEVYCAVYSVLDGQFFKVNEVTFLPLEQLRSRILTPTFFIGPEIGNYRPALEALLGDRARVDTAPAHPSAFVVGLLGGEKFADQQIGDSDLEPVYLRAPATKK